MSKSKPDRLSALINNFRVGTQVLPLGKCQIGKASDCNLKPNLFIITKGSLHKYDQRFPNSDAQTPVLVFFPRDRINSETCAVWAHDVEFICAAVDTGGDYNPISLALPEVATIVLDDTKSLKTVVDVLISEACSPRCGGQAVIDRLCEIVVIQLLRHLIEKRQTSVGLIAGLAHPNLSLAIVAIHDAPEKKWHLEDLAETAGMSRTHFANMFHKVLGVPAGEYLSNWRLTLARIEIGKGTRLKAIVQKVGFSSTAALSRAFKRRYGITPRQDLAPLVHKE